MRERSKAHSSAGRKQWSGALLQRWQGPLTLGGSLGGCRVRLKGKLHIQVAERRAGRFVISIDCVRPALRTNAPPSPIPNRGQTPTNRAATKHTRALARLHVSCVPARPGKRGANTVTHVHVPHTCDRISHGTELRVLTGSGGTCALQGPKLLTLNAQRHSCSTCARRDS